MAKVTPVDLLVFGPHPDDIEIGIGGIVARHTAAGHRVGLCDLTHGELSSNGTPSSGSKRLRRPLESLARPGARISGGRMGALPHTPEIDSIGGGLIRQAQTASRRDSVLGRSSSGSR